MSDFKVEDHLTAEEIELYDQWLHMLCTVKGKHIQQTKSQMAVYESLARCRAVMKEIRRDLPEHFLDAARSGRGHTTEMSIKHFDRLIAACLAGRERRRLKNENIHKGTLRSMRSSN